MCHIASDLTMPTGVKAASIDDDCVKNYESDEIPESNEFNV